MSCRAAARLLPLWLLAGSFAAGAGPEPSPEELMRSGLYPRAIESARQALARSDLDARAWWVLGECLRAVGRYRTALDAYRSAGELSEGYAMRIHVARARIEWLLNRRESASARLRSVLSSHASAAARMSSPELAAVADAARLLGRESPSYYQTALRIFEQAIERDPDNLDARVAFGDLLLEKYNNAEALELYREVLAVDGRHLGALLGLARSHHFDHSQNAVDIVRRSLEISPDWLPARVFQARLLLELESYDAAEAELRTVLDTFRSAPEALTLMAALAYLRGDPTEFSAAINRLLEHAPGYLELHLTLAEIAAQNRRYQDAVEFAAAAVAADNKSWRGHGLLGINRLRLGHIGAGRRNLELAFQGDPFNVWSRNTLELLDRMNDFQVIAAGRFVLVAERREAPVLAPLLLPLAERAYDHFAERYGVDPPTPIRIEVFGRHEDFSVRTVGLVGVDLLGVSFGPVVVLDSPSTRAFGPTHLGSTLWHELAHSFHLWMTEHRMPRWFSEGLAVHEEHRARAGWGADPSPDFLRAYAAGRLKPPSDLNMSFLRPSGRDELLHAYFQGYLLMDMIEAEHGFDAITAWLRGYRQSRTTSDLIKEVLGFELAEFDRRFDHYVRDRFGEALLAMASPDSDKPGEPRFLRTWREGFEAFRADDFDGALVLLEQAKELFPEFAGENSPYHLLAELHERRGDTARVIAELEALLKIDADAIGAYRKLADLYAARGDLERAREHWAQALFIEPFDLDLHALLADSYESAGLWPLAVDQRRAIVALEPPDPLEARFKLARAMMESAMFDLARSEVLAVLEQAPLYEDALELLLRLREARQRPDTDA